MCAVAAVPKVLNVVESSPGVKSFAASVMSIKPQLTKEGEGDEYNGGGERRGNFSDGGR